MSKSYLIVFHGDFDGNKIIDVGNDPCFENPPSWGICRPNTRKYVQKGDTLIFLAKIRNDYFVKGWFKVEEKIDYVTALEKFPNRRNVIISKIPRNNIPTWNNKKKELQFIKRHSNISPNFLTTLNSYEGVFFQNNLDDHALDNWKCKRIFQCRDEKLNECILSNFCNLTNESLKDKRFSNYIVGNHTDWEDLDYLKLNFNDLANSIDFKKSLKTPKGQHNVLKFDEYLECFIQCLSKIKSLRLLDKTTF